MRPWEPRHLVTLIDETWNNIDIATLNAVIRCPVDGAVMSADVALLHGPERYRIAALCPRPDCGKFFYASSLDDPLIRDAVWTVRQRRDLVGQAAAGRPLRCPADGATLRVGRFEDEDGRLRYWIRCLRCGNEHK